jgi:tRNA nucleotidyltransferase/poly(A) polymerase
MYLTFEKFLEAKEANGPKKTSTDTKLEKGQEFLVEPRSGSHPELAPIIKAFNDSSEVRIGDFIRGGYKTIKKGGELEEPTLGKKELYLVGGAVRDHLMGKSPKDLDLATDATPSEIRMILLNKGFTEKEAQGGKHKKEAGEKIHAPKGITSDPNKIFYAKGWDREGSEFVMGIRVKGSPEIELATFRKDSKSGDGRTPDKMTFSGLEDDAARRDFTINAMYLKLDNPKGPNTKLVDPHSGIAHLKSKELRFVGKAKDRLEEDQLRGLRYIRFVSRFGSPKKIPAVYEDAIRELSEQGFPAVSKERIRDEFLKGLEHKDIDPKEYIRIYKKLGVLHTVFPNMDFHLDTPADYSGEQNRFLAIAWILRKNDPDKVETMLRKHNWTNEEAKKISHLIKMTRFHGEIDPEELHGFHKSHLRSGLLGKNLEKWGRMNKMPAHHLKAFLKHTDEPRTKAIISGRGGDYINPAVADLFDPMTDRPHVGREHEVGDRLKGLEHQRWRETLKKHEKP